MTLALRPYQRAAVEALYDYFSASAGNPLVVMPKGAARQAQQAPRIRRRRIPPMLIRSRRARLSRAPAIFGCWASIACSAATAPTPAPWRA